VSRPCQVCPWPWGPSRRQANYNGMTGFLPGGLVIKWFPANFRTQVFKAPSPRWLVPPLVGPKVWDFPQGALGDLWYWANFGAGQAPGTLVRGPNLVPPFWRGILGETPFRGFGNPRGDSPGGEKKERGARGAQRVQRGKPPRVRELGGNNGGKISLGGPGGGETLRGN